eukprot:jgi/Psemu1/235664/estExt_Genewise1.C_320026
MSVAQAERAVGWSAITGTGLVAARVALYAYRSLRGDGRIDDEISDCTTEVPKDDRVPKDVVTKPQRRTASYSILGLIRRTLRRILLEESEFIARAPSAITDDMTETNEESEGSLVSHQGSCHCESIQFTVLAPRVLTAQDGPGKIQFRHTQVKASNFRIYAGYEHLKSYYVFYHATGTGNKGAHAFCERCGVHVLYAPSKSTPYLSINVRCLRDDDAHKIKLTSKKDGISEGIPVAGQFDNVNFSDHLSTISEVTQPFHFQMNHNHNHNHNHNSFNSNNFNSSFNNNNHHQHQRPPTNRHVQQQQQQQQQRSELESSIVSVDGAIEVFYPNQPEKRFRRQLQRPMTPTTSSLTTTEEAESSGSLYKGQMNEMEMMIPTSPAPRSGGASSSFGGVDDFSFTGESVSLMDPDNLSISSPKSGTISIRRNTKMRTAENQNPNGVPRHPTVTSPETRNKMKFFMSKYKKQSSAAGAAAGTN